MSRLKDIRRINEQRIDIETRFIKYQTMGNDAQAERQTSVLRKESENLKAEWERLNELKPSDEAEALLKHMIIFLQELSTKVKELTSQLLT